MQDLNISPEPSRFSLLDRFRDSTTIKLAAIGILVLLLQIPTSMVRRLIHEREGRNRSVTQEISSKWGSPQTLAGPILTVPFKEPLKPAKGQVQHVRYLHILPEQLDVHGHVNTELRYRGIFEAVVFSGTVTSTGSFLMPQMEKLGLSPKQVQWADAFVSYGITDMRGISKFLPAKVGTAPVQANPGIPVSEVLSSGVSFPVALSEKEAAIPFELALTLNGSDGLKVVPVGKTSVVKFDSNWTSPSFDGAFLPTERTIGPTGFTALWRVLHLNRNYPQYWIGSQHEIMSSAFGVRMFLPADAYQKSERTAKYAVLFIVLTFVAFFLAELLTRARVMIFQYFLIGLALVVFYSLLLSISEHLGFDGAYAISAVATILLISLYSRSVFRKEGLPKLIGVLLTILYAYLYGLLRNEDYAMLLGSVGLFAILAVVMFVTRKLGPAAPPR